MRVVGRARDFVRERPGLRRAVEGALGPVFLPVARLVQWLDRPPYRRWRRAALRRAASVAIPGPDVPPLVVELAAGRGRARSLASLRAQRDPAWRLGARADAAGAFWLRLPAGATLAPDAVARLRGALAGRGVLLAYADEDRRGWFGRPGDPWLKTAFDADRVLVQDMLGRCVAFRSGALESAASELSKRYIAPGQDSTHALTLRVLGPHLRAAIAPVRHVPAVLLTRAHSDRVPWTSGFDATAVGAALRVDGRGAALVPGPRAPRVVWPLPAAAPLVSVIVPTRDRAELLGPCLDGLLRRTDYPALEVLVADNGSTAPDALALLRDAARDPRVRVLPLPGPFNYSAINNRAVAEASGALVLLLNNDTEVRDPGWLRELASLAVRAEVGAVGARLLFPNGRVQHAGVTLGLGGVAGHDLLLAPGRDDGPQSALRVVRSVSAATAACLMLRREVFLDAGGLDEVALPIAYNDVDLCLRIRARGLRILVTPWAELLHKESASRGQDMAPEHRARWERERAVMRARWGGVLDSDPFWHPAQSLVSSQRQLDWAALKAGRAFADAPR